MSNTLKKWNGELLEAMRAAAIKPSHPKKDEKLEADYNNFIEAMNSIKKA